MACPVPSAQQMPMPLRKVIAVPIDTPVTSNPMWHYVGQGTESQIAFMLGYNIHIVTLLQVDGEKNVSLMARQSRCNDVQDARSNTIDTDSRPCTICSYSAPSFHQFMPRSRLPTSLPKPIDRPLYLRCCCLCSRLLLVVASTGGRQTHKDLE